MLAETTTVLLTSAGLATAGNVIFGLRKIKDFKVNIISVDMSKFSANLHLSDSFFVVPPVIHPTYIDSLINICRKEKVDFIFPLFSGEILLISKNKSLFEYNNIDLLVPDSSVVELCNDKIKFSKFLQNHNFRTPKIYFDSSKIKYPFLTKPNDGSSIKKDIFLVDDEKTKEFLISKFPNNIMQEFIKGKEYTVDCLTHNGEVFALCPRLRMKVKDGKCMVGKTIYSDFLNKEVKRLLLEIGMEGPCNIQVIENENGEFYFIEINPRLAAGGLPLTIRAGLNIPEMMLKIGLGFKVHPKEEYITNLYMSRYLSEIFLSEQLTKI